MSQRPVLYAQIYDHMRQEIISGRYKSGDPLPTEQQLMAQFSVSRITTNRALQMLTADGLVTRRAGVGTFVRDPSHRAARAADAQTPADFARGAATPSQSGALRITPSRAGGRTLIGLVVPYIRDRRDIALISAVERHLHERGFSLALRCSYGDQGDERAAIEELRDLGADGLIVSPVNGQFYNAALLQAHLDRFPTVLVETDLPGIPLPHVTTDNGGAAQTLTRHLQSLGHSRIAFVIRQAGDATGATALSEQVKGFAAAMEEAGMRSAGTLVLDRAGDGAPDNGAGQAATLGRIAHFLADNDPIDALLVSDGRLAMQAREALGATVHGVGPQPEIACLDGDAMGGIREFGPGLPEFTHARRDPDAMTGAAVGILAEVLAGTRAVGHEPVRVAARLAVRAVAAADGGETRDRRPVAPTPNLAQYPSLELDAAQAGGPLC